jgi:tetratricopeptide (TPR) repeat protein
MNRGNFLAITILLTFFSCKNDTTITLIKPKPDATFIKKIAQQVAINSDSVGLRFNYIEALDSVGDYKTAIVQIDSLIFKDRGNYALWFKRAKLHEHAKDTVQAIDSYNKALAIYRSADGLLALANLYAETKNVLVLAICNELDNLRIGREYDSYTNFFRGVYYARIGNSQQANLLFDKSIVNNYTFIDAYMEKGFLLYDGAKFSEALGVFKKANSVNVTYADAYYWQGKCYEAMNNKLQAMAQYQQTLALDKYFVEAQVAVMRLKSEK